MGKKNKNKPKKINPKRERYAKFHKEKPGTLDITMPDLSDEETKNKRNDEDKIERFLRYRPKNPMKFVVERKAKSKR